MQAALSIIGDRRNKEAAEKKAKEKELLKVSIKKEDVDLIVRQISWCTCYVTSFRFNKRFLKNFPIQFSDERNGNKPNLSGTDTQGTPRKRRRSARDIDELKNEMGQKILFPFVEIDSVSQL